MKTSFAVNALAVAVSMARLSQSVYAQNQPLQFSSRMSEASAGDAGDIDREGGNHEQ